MTTERRPATQTQTKHTKEGRPVCLIGFNPFEHLDRLIGVLAAIKARIDEDDASRPRKSVKSSGILERCEFWTIFHHHFEDLFSKYKGTNFISRLGTCTLSSDEDSGDTLLVRVRHPSGWIRGFRIGQGCLRILASKNPETDLREIFNKQKYQDKRPSRSVYRYEKKTPVYDWMSEANRPKLWELLKLTDDNKPVAPIVMAQIVIKITGLTSIRPSEIGRLVLSKIVGKDEVTAIIFANRNKHRIIESYVIGQEGRRLLAEMPVDFPHPTVTLEKPIKAVTAKPKSTQKEEPTKTITTSPIDAVSQLAQASRLAATARNDMKVLAKFRQHCLDAMDEIQDDARRDRLAAAAELLEEAARFEEDQCAQQIQDGINADMTLNQIRQLVNT